MIINGKINPPISDALITLKFPNNPALASLETKSDHGSFKFGPFDGSLNVEITAFKESYVFSEYDKVNQLFKAHKLCEIIAVVRDEQKNQLPGVSISIFKSDDRVHEMFFNSRYFCHYLVQKATAKILSQVTTVPSNIIHYHLDSTTCGL